LKTETFLRDKRDCAGVLRVFQTTAFVTHYNSKLSGVAGEDILNI